MMIVQQFTLQFVSDDKEALSAFVKVLTGFTTIAGDKARADEVSLTPEVLCDAKR